MVLMEEFHQLEKHLAQSPSTLVLIDKHTFALQGWQVLDRGLKEFVELLQKNYDVTAETGSSFLLARRPVGELLLSAEDGAILHVGAQRPGASYAFVPFLTQPRWSLELLIAAQRSKLAKHETPCFPA